MSLTQIELPPIEAARRYKGASLDQRRLERRGQLIEAAIGVYGERGYRNATVKSVCQAAGLTERYFYESFANSEALLGAAFAQVMIHLLARMTEAAEAAGTDPLARARATLMAYYTVLRESPQGARVFLVEIFGVSPEVDALLRKALKDMAGVLLHREAPAGDLVAAGAIGAVIQIALDWIASGYQAPVDEAVEIALGACGGALA
ncbi:MAG: transcriptional regulator, TetR family [Caulobacter sp.]|nr:transcriptional regulator, TetR family [Caulobacter sp.]